VPGRPAKRKQLFPVPTLAGGLVPVPAVHRRTVVYRRPAWRCLVPWPRGRSCSGKLAGSARSGRFRVPVPGMAGTGFDLPADQGAGRPQTPWKKSFGLQREDSCADGVGLLGGDQPVIEAAPTPPPLLAALCVSRRQWFFTGDQPVIEAAPAGRADGDGDTIRTHGTNVIEAAAAAVTASTWPMRPTWFSPVGSHRGPIP
jgi:hypothetical protein